MNLFATPYPWKWMRLEDVCDPIASSIRSGGYRCVDASSIDIDLKTITKTVEMVVEKVLGKTLQGIAANDVLVKTDSPDLRAVALVPEGLDGQLCSDDFLVLRARRQVLDPTYLFYWLQHPHFVQSLARLRRGAHAPVSARSILDSRIPLPSLSEQERIVAIVREADRLRRLRHEAKRKIRDFPVALFDEMFERESPSQHKLEMVEVRDVGEVLSGRTRASETRTGRLAFPCIRAANISEDHIDISDVSSIDLDPSTFEKYRLNEGDILLAEGHGSESAGRAAMWRGQIKDCCFHSSVVRFRPKLSIVNPEFALAFFRACFKRGELTRLASKAGHLSAAKIAELPFPLLRSSGQQIFAEKSFVRRVEKMRDVSKDQSQSLKRLHELLNSMLFRSFSGELTAAWREENEKDLSADIKRRNAFIADVEVAEMKTARSHYDTAFDDLPDELVEELEKPDVSFGEDSTEVVKQTPDEAIKLDRLDRRYYALRDISSEQYEVYLASLSSTGYFIPESLSEKSGLDLTTVQRGLAALASCGLVQEVSLLIDHDDLPDNTIITAYTARRPDAETISAEEEGL